MGGKPTAMIAMSGGVDSSVAALLAIRMGYDCTGVTMKLYGDDGDDGGGAASVAAALGIPHRIIDFTNEFRESVIEPFVSSYEAGKTPNPCIDCNIRIKFGLLFHRARLMGFDKLVTGHYARIVWETEGSSGGRGGGFRLGRAADAGKDQSYFLYGIAPEKLEHIIFPLGGLKKKETRAIAEEAGFNNANAKESQDICFIKEGGHAGFIEGFRGEPPAPGNFVDTSGRILGRHSGVVRYTIGQRKGLGAGFGRPLFVKDIRPERGEVVLADEEEIFASRIEISDVNWHLPGEGLLRGGTAIRAEVLIRYGAKPAWATVSRLSDDRLLAKFDEAVRAPARGQSAVLYDGNLVIGGGRIV
jgi:tRNA-specific 2-thiouridylase